MSKPTFRYNLRDLARAAKAKPGAYYKINSDTLSHMHLYVGRDKVSVSYYRKINGRPKRAQLGNLDSLTQETLDQIKANWKKAHALAERDIDPTNYSSVSSVAIGQDSEGKTNTVRLVIEMYETDQGLGNTKGTKDNRWRYLQKHSKDFLDRSPGSLTTEEIGKRYREIANQSGRPTGKCWLNYLLAPMRAQKFHHKIDLLPEKHADPVFIRKDQVGGWYRLASTYHHQIRDKPGEMTTGRINKTVAAQTLGKLAQFIMLAPLRNEKGCMLRGVPFSEEDAVRKPSKYKSYVDFEHRMIVIPRPKNYHKTQCSFELPLSDEAFELIAHREGEEWVFPNSRGGPAQDSKLCELFKWLCEVTNTREEVTPHKVRSTFRTHAGGLGIDVDSAEACLNHKPRGIERKYVAQTPEAMREAMNSWGDWVVSQADPAIARPVRLSRMNPETWERLMALVDGEAKAILCEAAGMEPDEESENVVAFRRA